MQAQLELLIVELESARDRLRALEKALPDELWLERPPAGGWSMSECVEHLNRTSEEFLPSLLEALDRARTLGSPRRPRLRRDPAGFLLWKTLGPPVRLLRVKTGDRFVPNAAAPPPVLRARFDELQGELIRAVAAADGLAIDRVKVSSPFDSRVRYNLFSAFGIVARHQHRHLWQAEVVAGELRRAGTGAKESG